MAEYIDRKKFLKRLGEEYPGIPPHGAIVVGMLCDEEPADVRPVVRGRWVINNGRWCCDKCTCPVQVVRSSFCPNCGAKLKSEKEDEVS